MKKIRVSLTTMIWIILSLYSTSELFIPMVLAIALHEMGHIICARIVGARISRVTLSPLGARIELERDVPYKNELILALGGPMFGIIAHAITIILSPSHPTLYRFSAISLALSVFNLLPLSTLDGGRALGCILNLVLPLRIADRISRICTFFTLFGFWIFTVYIMIKFSGGLSAFVFCAIFFVKCFILDSKNGDL